MEGAFICPEGATAIVAAKVLREQGWIKQSGICYSTRFCFVLTPKDKVVILNTGTGFKYPGMFHKNLPILEIGQQLPV